jgi:hypothetical protein
MGKPYSGGVMGDGPPLSYESEAQRYFQKSRLWSGVSVNKWLGNYVSRVESPSIAVGGTGAALNILGSPGLPGAATGATAASFCYVTLGSIYSSNFPTYLRAVKKSYFASRFAISTMGLAGSARFELMKSDGSLVGGYVGSLTSVSTTNFICCDQTGANKVNGPALDTLEHVHEVYLTAAGALEKYVVDGVSYGGNAVCFINAGANNLTIRWATDNNALAVDRRILPRWVTWGTDGN